jgi:hypothetical protein
MVHGWWLPGTVSIARVSFFFHAKGVRNETGGISARKIESNGDISPAKGSVKSGQSISPHMGTREPPLLGVRKKRSLAWQRRGGLPAMLYEPVAPPRPSREAVMECQ